MCSAYHDDDVASDPMLPLAYPIQQTAYDQYPVQYPAVGQVRCYWCLINSSLDFVYLDPVLGHHLQEQADLLLGKSIIEFVHPDEQQSARRDLAQVLQTGNLDGTLTRMRFSRLSRVRRLLGHHGPVHSWPDAEKIAIDANYMAVDLVVNVAADDLLLCFIHAAVDLNGPRDSDQHCKTHWTNWCGTDAFVASDTPALWTRLLRAVSPPASMSRVFQITANTRDLPRHVLFTWPPEPAPGHGPSARDFARLSDGVNIDAESIAASTAKTSCTRRFKVREQAMNSQDAYRLVDSVFIPHGSIVFACHQVIQQRRAPMPTAAASAATNASMHSLYMTQPPHQHYLDSTFSLPSMHTVYHHHHHHHLPAQQPHTVPPQPAYSTWHPSPATPPAESPAFHSAWQTHPATTAPPPTYTPTLAPANVQAYAQQQQSQSQQAPPPAQTQTPHSLPPPPQPQQQQSQASSAWTYVPDSESYRTSSPQQQQYYDAPFAPLDDTRQTISTPAPAAASTPAPAPALPLPTRRRTSPSDVGPGGSRTGHPPSGVLRCSSCKATQSPEWRKGPSGKKDLCNACGLRFARSRAKKDGVSAARRRREMGAGVGAGTGKVSATGVVKREESRRDSLGADAYTSDYSAQAPMSSVKHEEVSRDGFDAAYALAQTPMGTIKREESRRDGFDVSYMPASSSASTPSPPMYHMPPQQQQHQHQHQQAAPVQGKERFYHPSPLVGSGAPTQLPPFHELPNTHTHPHAPGHAPVRPAF